MSAHVLEYSGDGKYLASIISEGKLQVWDVETNELTQEYIPNLHLCVPCTAITWVNLKKGSDGRGSSVANQSNRSYHIALGTLKGGVLIYSLADAKIMHELKGIGHSEPVCGICANGNILYTVGSDCTIVRWSLTKGAQIIQWTINPDKPSGIATLSDSNKIVTASKQLNVWHSRTGELIQSFTGHSSQVSALHTLNALGKDYIVSTSTSDRIVWLWEVDEESNSSNGFGSFLMEDIAKHVICRSDDDGNLQIVTVTRSGVMHVFNKSVTMIEKNKPVKPEVTVEVVENGQDNIHKVPIVAANFNSASTDNNVSICYGDGKLIKFETITIDFSKKRMILIRDDPRNAICNGKKKKSFSLVTPTVNPSTVEFSMLSIPSKNAKSIEIPMETRLENLSVSVNGDKNPAVANHVAQLLMQGLHSKDADILRQVFETNKVDVIRLTLQKLPPQYITVLVEQLTNLIRKKTANVERAITWLNILIQSHLSQIMAFGNEELVSQFGSCMAVVEHRTNNLKALANVSGRLDLFMSRLYGNEKDNFDENVVIYNDANSSSGESDYDLIEDFASEESDEDMEGNGVN